MTDIIQNIKQHGWKIRQQITLRKRSHVECFQWIACVKERSWVSIEMEDLLRIILHFIASCIAFYCQLDLQ